MKALPIIALFSLILSDTQAFNPTPRTIRVNIIRTSLTRALITGDEITYTLVPSLLNILKTKVPYPH